MSAKTAACAVCGGRIVYLSRSFTWRHTSHEQGQNHAPVPSKETR